MLSWEERYNLGITDFDVHSDLQIDQRSNVLVQALHENLSDEGHQFEAIMCKSGLPNAVQIIHGHFEIQPHTNLNIPVKIHCQPDQKSLLYSSASDFVVLAFAHVSAIDPVTLHLDENSVVYNNCSGKKHSIMSIEFCAGGFGGWAMAAKFLKRVHHLPFIRTLAIDYDQKAIQNWLMTFGGHYVETQANIPWQLIELFHDNLGIAADVQDRHWKQLGAAFAPSLATISAPCVSWTGANSQKGLYSEGGITLMASIMECKFLRPRVILLEQVRNFESHPHYPKAMQLLNAAGYRVIFHKVIDAGDGCPMARPRWLAIACDALSKHDYDLATFLPQWLGDMYFHPASFGCMLKLDEEEKSLMYLPQQTMAKYFQPNLAPSCMKNNLVGKRSTRPWQKMPTLMAAYGKQHTFSDHELQTHGLYGHFLAETDPSNPQLTQLRLWHPKELAIMFMPVFDLVIMKDHQTAWKHLGNAIATNHACFLLVAVLPLLLIEGTNLTTRDALLSLLEHRLHKGNLVVQSHPKCWILTLEEESQYHLDRIENFLSVIKKEIGSIPHATFFHTAKGIIAFSDIRQLWDHNQVLEPVLPITPTQNCWMKLQVCIGDIKIHGTNILPLVAVDQILGFWSYHAATQLLDVTDLHDPDQFHFQQLLLGITDHENHRMNDDQEVTIMLYHSNQAWIVRAPKNHEGLQDYFPEFPRLKVMHNALQQLQHDRVPKVDMILFEELPSHNVITVDPCRLVDMILNIRTHVHTRPKHDELIIMMDLQQKRDEFQCHLLQFVNEMLPHEWLHKHGRRAEIDIHQGAVQILFRPNGVTIPLPIPDLLEVTLFHMLRCFWTTLANSTTQPAVQLRMKWDGQVFWQGKLPATLVIQWIRSVTSIFMQPILDVGGLHVVAFGQRAGELNSLGELQMKSAKADLILQGSRSLMIAFVPSVSGGGPTKQTWDVEIRNQIASTLLPMGVSVDNLATIADTVLKSTGRAKLQQILKQTNGDLKKQQLIDVVENTGFSISKLQKTQPKPQPLLKKPRADQIRQELLDMDLDGVQIEPGFFFAGIDEPVSQIDKLYPKTTGIVLTKEPQVRDWLIANHSISPDPLGAFVVGSHELATELPYQNVLIPARTPKGLPLILSGALVQLGERSIHYKPHHDEASFHCTTDTQVVSVTAWKDEMNLEEWQDLLRKPTSFMQSIFSEQGTPSTFLSTWGTSFQAKGKVTEKPKAESVQIHATIAKDSLPDALRKSGINGVFIIPKTSDGNPDTEWKIIWLPTPIKVPGARDEALRVLARVQQPFGIVRNKVSYGIRVREDHFKEAWQIIHPQQPIPTTIADKTVYKVTPLPFGCPPETIKQWLVHIEWNAVAVRPVGPKSWIIASLDEPPSQFVTFNGNPTLIRRLPSRESKPIPAVVAGQKLQTSQHPLPPLAGDPWAGYKPSSSAGVSSGPKVSEPVVGMVQKQIQKQDDKIQTLADEVANLRKMQESAQQDTAQKFTQVEQAVDKNKEAFAQQLSHLKQELETSFQQAITSQNNSINQGFSELKAMFQQTARNPPSRRTWDEANKEQDAEM